jgi:hypothetical protein
MRSNICIRCNPFLSVSAADGGPENCPFCFVLKATCKKSKDKDNLVGGFIYMHFIIEGEAGAK